MIAEMILPEFAQEMLGTRKTLERIPAAIWEWKAHPKSNSVGWVASHLADIPEWVEGILTGESWDIHPVGSEPEQVRVASGVGDLLATFDSNVAKARKVLEVTKDEAFSQPWSLKQQGQVLFTMPRLAVLRGFVLNHSIHHRAMLCVYLRLNDVPVPALYGPSGDEDPS